MIDSGIEIRAVTGLPGDDQWSTGFVDQNRINLVDDSKIEFPLYAIFDCETQIIVHVIKTELVIGPVGNISPVGFAFSIVIHGT